jgi:hypothetical protein
MIMQVMIDDLIKALKKIRKEKGDIPVKVAGFLGTNSNHVVLQLDRLPNYKDSINGYGSLHLSVSLDPESRKRIVEGIHKMESLGYTFYPSQFRMRSEVPQTGVSPCDWHNPW